MMLVFIFLISFGIVGTLEQQGAPCDASICIIGESCTIANSPYVCQCMPGYHGENCSDINECKIGKGDPCGHRGVCINAVGSYRCNCLVGWSGPHCHNNITDNPECMPGYSGTACSVSECDHGYPVNDTAGFRCCCDTGWTHDHIYDKCSTDIDECAIKTAVCQNGGSCTNTNGSYHCDCVKPWEQQNCTYYNLCSLNPCEHEGTCTMVNKSYVCECTNGWQGYNCSDDVDECSKELASSMCLHGNCTNYLGSYNCSCMDEWLGFNCNETVIRSTLTFTNTETTESSTYDSPDTSSKHISGRSEADDTRSPGYYPSTDIVTNGGRQGESHKYLKSSESSAAEDSSQPVSLIVGVTVSGLAAITLCCLVGYILFKRKLSKVSATDITEEPSSQ